MTDAHLMTVDRCNAVLQKRQMQHKPPFGMREPIEDQVGRYTYQNRKRNYT